MHVLFSLLKYYNRLVRFIRLSFVNEFARELSCSPPPRRLIIIYQNEIGFFGDYTKLQ